MASAVAHRATADAAEEEWIADTGATVTATTSSALVNPRTSNKVLLDFTNGEGTNAMVEGDVNMWFYDHKSGEGVGLQMPAVAVRPAAPHPVRRPIRGSLRGRKVALQERPQLRLLAYHPGRGWLTQ